MNESFYAMVWAAVGSQGKCFAFEQRSSLSEWQSRDQSFSTDKLQVHVWNFQTDRNDDGYYSAVQRCTSIQ